MHPREQTNGTQATNTRQPAAPQKHVERGRVAACPVGVPGLGITDKASWHRWLKNNHPDKNPDTKARAFAEVWNAVAAVGLDGDERGAPAPAAAAAATAFDGRTAWDRDAAADLGPRRCEFVFPAGHRCSAAKLRTCQHFCRAHAGPEARKAAAGLAMQDHVEVAVRKAERAAAKLRAKEELQARVRAAVAEVAAPGRS